MPGGEGGPPSRFHGLDEFHCLDEFDGICGFDYNYGTKGFGGANGASSHLGCA
jgi:hypothetical protein